MRRRILNNYSLIILAVWIYVAPFCRTLGNDSIFPTDLKTKNDSSLEHLDTREKLINETKKSWRFDPLPMKTDEGLIKDASLSTEEQLKKIIIPKISFNNIPLNRALDNISEILLQLSPEQQSINLILINPNQSTPSVSLTLKNASLERVLSYLTKVVNYYYEIEGDSIVIRPSDTVHQDIETEFFPISRATALRLSSSQQSETNKTPDITREEASIKSFLERAGISFSNTPGSNLAFDGTQLIVTQSPRNLRRVKKVIQRCQETKQVEIEAKFIEVQEGALEELGIRWQADRKNSTAQSKDSLRSLSEAFSPQPLSTSADPILSGDTTPISVNNTPPQIPNAINLGTSSTNLANIAGVLGEFQVNALLKALEQHGSADLMSAPKLTVLSNKTAKIIVAQELRYPESYGNIASDVGSNTRRGGGSAGVAITAGTPRDFKTRNIGVEMEVTPIVEENNAITLKLNPQVTEFEGFVEYGGSSIAVTETKSVTVNSGFFQPIFSTRQIHTEVTIDNGATVVMGGLTREEIKKVKDKVPILGDIPLLGRLFRSTGETSQKKNLLILVTAKLVSPSGVEPTKHEIVIHQDPVNAFN